MDHFFDSAQYQMRFNPMGLDALFSAFIGGIAKPEDKHREKLNTIDKDGNVIEEGRQ